MDRSNILAEIDAEISRLQQVKTLLTSIEAKQKTGRPAAVSSTGKATGFNPGEFNAKPKKRRTMSTAGRARIAAAQRARWAKLKKSTPSKRTAPAKKADTPKEKPSAASGSAA